MTLLSPYSFRSWSLFPLFQLREIEILLQSYTGPDKATADKVFEILYATDGEDFVAADTLQDDTHMGDQDTSQDHSVPY